MMDHHHDLKCKIVVVGDTQCGKTSLLNVFAKDSFPEVCVEKDVTNMNVNSAFFSLSCVKCFV